MTNTQQKKVKVWRIKSPGPEEWRFVPGIYYKTKKEAEDFFITLPQEQQDFYQIKSQKVILKNNEK